MTTVPTATDVRFEGSNGIYKVFARQGDAYVYERTITTSANTRKAKLDALEAARSLEQYHRDIGDYEQEN